uniref:Uncharacterized protein n=1 Tax=Oryza barthii TaxID=65489 RepID=A0A0D3FMC6_9ORYZ
MPTGFVRDKAEGGKSGSVAPLRHPAAHVPCSLAAKSASSKKRVEECLRQEVYEKAPTPARVKRQRICQIAILAMRFSSHHSPLSAGKFTIGLFGDEVPADGGGVISGIAVEGGDSIRGKS